MKTSALFGYPVLSVDNEIFFISSYSSSIFSVPPALLYFISTSAKENNCMMGHAFASIPICPVGIDGLVFTPFGFRTTLFRIPPDGDMVHGVKEDSPFVNPKRVPDLGTATPSVSEKLAPKTDVPVLLLQKTPKSKLFPSAPTPASRTI